MTCHLRRSTAGISDSHPPLLRRFCLLLLLHAGIGDLVPVESQSWAANSASSLEDETSESRDEECRRYTIHEASSPVVYNRVPKVGKPYMIRENLW